VILGKPSHHNLGEKHDRTKGKPQPTLAGVGRGPFDDRGVVDTAKKR
jgi:hypothetical protein